MEPTGIEPVTSISEGHDSHTVTSNAPEPLAHSLAYQVEKDPSLKLLVERWHCLPEAIRAGIAAMVKATSASESKEAL